MMPEESSTQRSVNRVVICGVVTRMMTKAKKPISAAVTATIAISRAAPRPFRKVTKTLQRNQPLGFGTAGPTGQILPMGWFQYG